MESKKEVWKDVKGYEGLYQISSLGNVRSLDRIVKHKKSGNLSLSGSMLKPAINKYGYVCFILCRDGKPKNLSAHRIVALSFIKNQHGKKCVNHINGRKSDNRVDNLEWVTHSENTYHAYRTNIKKSYPVLQYSLSNDFIERYESAGEAGRILGFQQGNISACCKGKRPSANGFKWRFENGENYKSLQK